MTKTDILRIPDYLEHILEAMHDFAAAQGVDEAATMQKAWKKVDGFVKLGGQLYRKA